MKNLPEYVRIGSEGPALRLDKYRSEKGIIAYWRDNGCWGLYAGVCEGLLIAKDTHPEVYSRFNGEILNPISREEWFLDEYGFCEGE